jgi:hypothetical protein
MGIAKKHFTTHPVKKIFVATLLAAACETAGWLTLAGKSHT